jgi:hypothetical protein
MFKVSAIYHNPQTLTSQYTVVVYRMRTQVAVYRRTLNILWDGSIML